MQQYMLLQRNLVYTGHHPGQEVGGAYWAAEGFGDGGEE
jgi:hypothetical protein